MYNYAANDSIIEGVSNIYMLSTATVFLAVIIAMYCANMLRDDGDGTTEVDSDVEHLNKLIDSEASSEGTLKENALGEYSDDVSDLTQSWDGIAGEEDSDFNEDCDNIDDNDDGDADIKDVNMNGIVGKLKTAQFKKLESQLTSDQLQEERRIEREQLAAIFELLKKQETELNMKEIDENELNAQLNLYR